MEAQTPFITGKHWLTLRRNLIDTVAMVLWVQSILSLCKIGGEESPGNLFKDSCMHFLKLILVGV